MYSSVLQSAAGVVQVWFSNSIIYLRTFIRVMVSCSVDYCSFVMKSMMDFAIFMKEIVLTPSKTISD